jgi:hypothetical protein
MRLEDNQEIGILLIYGGAVQCRVPIIFLAHFARIKRLTVLAHPFCTAEPSRCQIPSICPRNNYYSNLASYYCRTHGCLARQLCESIIWQRHGNLILSYEIPVL